MHLNFMTPKGLKITPSNGKKERRARKGRQWRKKGLTFLLILMLSTLKKKMLA